MSIFILSPRNELDVPGTLARALRAEGEDVRCVSYHPPLPGDEVDAVLNQLHPSQIIQLIEDLSGAKLIHVFDQGFTFRDFRLDECLSPQRALWSYGPDAFAEHWPALFDRHYRRGFLATVNQVHPHESLCPLAALTLPPVLEVSARAMPEGPHPIVGVVSQGSRETGALVSDALSELPAELCWMEGLCRRDRVRALSSLSLFVDDLRHPAPSPIALEALALGIPVVGRVTHLERCLWPGLPVAPATGETLSAVLAEQLVPSVRAAASAQASAYAEAELCPTRTLKRWRALYHHVQTNGQAIRGTP